MKRKFFFHIVAIVISPSILCCELLLFIFVSKSIAHNLFILNTEGGEEQRHALLVEHLEVFCKNLPR